MRFWHKSEIRRPGSAEQRDRARGRPVAYGDARFLLLRATGGKEPRLAPRAKPHSWSPLAACRCACGPHSIVLFGATGCEPSSPLVLRSGGAIRSTAAVRESLAHCLGLRVSWSKPTDARSVLWSWEHRKMSMAHTKWNRDGGRRSRPVCVLLAHNQHQIEAAQNHWTRAQMAVHWDQLSFSTHRGAGSC